MPKSRPFRRAFTLIELIAVIGIIALLLSLLLPALSGARRSAASVTCESNLRQWAIAIQLYAADYDGYLPRRGQGVQPTTILSRPTDWFNALPPMMKMPAYADLFAAGKVVRPGVNSIWICPLAFDSNQPYYWSYGMNMALSVWDANVNNGQPDKITTVGNNSIMVLMADGPGNYAALYPSVTPNGYNPVPRHNNYVNISFLDGHVEVLDATYVGCGLGLPTHADIRWRPPNSPWNSAK